ncbi:FAD-dependent oxidoreductase [Nocardioides sp. Soil796]|uniref:FAD-dependent oxidoreductase n=1 Tax=Nocardioides sp. Soil796 TaxID=1736412 RepID=UPI000B029086|nr:FAD-dependent oxidoreductase [Nocardioides sp. Soil796]
MQELETDVLVVGWGKAGKTLAGALGRAGQRVVMVEQSDEMYGGTCINIGCVPTKALVHQAEGRREGDDPQAWFTDAVAFRDTLIGKLRAKNYEMLDVVDTVTALTGRATFVDEHIVEVTGGDDVLRVRADTIIVNTGSVPVLPDLPGLVDNPVVHTSTTLQHVHPLPAELVVVGGGPIGLEFAGMFARFGSHVTVLDRGARLLMREDEDVADAVRGSLEEVGVTFVQGAKVTAIDGAVVRHEVDGEDREITADAVLVAVGRRPATDGLGLDAAGIDVTEKGAIAVDEHLRTSRPHVFAVGDVNGGPQFTYVSYDDHRIVLDQLTGSGTRTTGDRVAVPTTTFLTPPLGRVGVTEAEAREQGRTVQVAVKPVAAIAAMPRPKIVGETHGLIKFVVDADTDEVLGAALFCIDAQELVNLVALAMRAGVTASQLRDGIWTHPSSTESFNEVLAGLA